MSMTLRARRTFNVAVVLAGVAAAWVRAGAQSPLKGLTPQARLAAIRRAQVWTKTDVPSMDLRAGPQGPGAFAPNETVHCDYVKKEMSGNSPKFTCVIAKSGDKGASAESGEKSAGAKGDDKGDKDKAEKDKADEVKVKYGQANGEVYGEVAATRLLWALGFGADRMYPVRVVCRGCPSDPKKNPNERRSEAVFDPAAIERKMSGKTLETRPDSGWAWPELDLVDEAAGGAPRAQRDALKLLAVFMQHTDSKPAQQRLMCVAEHAPADDGACPQSFMMLNDVGLTFGHANVFNRNAPGGVNFDEWSHVQVWTDPKGCVGNLPKSMSGSLNNPVISEAGRKFLADLLVQLSDAQLHALFDVARFPLRSGLGGDANRNVTVDAWVDAFKKKRDEVVNRSCSP
jgi:hypothetical protein